MNRDREAQKARKRRELYRRQARARQADLANLSAFRALWESLEPDQEVERHGIMLLRTSEESNE
jgi:hypothetical protein